MQGLLLQTVNIDELLLKMEHTELTLNEVDQNV